MEHVRCNEDLWFNDFRNEGIGSNEYGDSDFYMHNRLLLLLVHVSGRVLHTGKVSLGKVDAADSVVVHRLEVDLAVSKVNGRRPLSGARHLRSLTLAMLNANRYVEIVKDVETLLHGIKGSRLFWCRGTIEGSPHETRWRSGVAWYTPEP